VSLALGTRLGPCEVIALLGAGGMGEVYRARDVKLSRDVAIKILLGPESHAVRFRSTKLCRWHARSLMHWKRRTSKGSFIAISSRRTSKSKPTAA